MDLSLKYTQDQGTSHDSRIKPPSLAHMGSTRLNPDRYHLGRLPSVERTTKSKIILEYHMPNRIKEIFLGQKHKW
jgi:hypothetical protein